MIYYYYGIDNNYSWTTGQTHNTGERRWNWFRLRKFEIDYTIFMQNKSRSRIQLSEWKQKSMEYFAPFFNNFRESKVRIESLHIHFYSRLSIVLFLAQNGDFYETSHHRGHYLRFKLIQVKWRCLREWLYWR